MRTLQRLSIILALLFALPAVGQTPSIEVAQPWARATPGAVQTAAVYLTLTDHGAADTLVGASSPVAETTTLHQTTTENGVVKMRMLDRVPLPPHVATLFKPGALHIMLTGLRQPLKAGEHFPLTLNFSVAPPVTAMVAVLAIGSAGPAVEAAGDMPGMKMP